MPTHEVALLGPTVLLQVLATFLRLLHVTSPLMNSLALLIGSQVGAPPALRAGLASEAAFLAGLVFVSNAPRLALLGLGLPLTAGLQLPVQLAMVAAAGRHNQETCLAVLTHTPWAGGRPPAPAPGATPAARMVWRLFASLAMLTNWMRPVLPLPSTLDAVQQCCVLFGMFQLTLGLCIPVLVHLALEAHIYRAHLYRAHRRALAVRAPAGASATGAGLAGAASAGRLQPPGAMDWVYRRAWHALKGTNAPAAVLVVTLVLGTLWELLTATV